MNTFFAQPYSTDAVGFYFSTLNTYTYNAESLLDNFGNPVEEFEIQFIGGDDSQLFSACDINQSNLKLWFLIIADLSEHEKTILYYLCSSSRYSLENALDKLEGVDLYEGSLKDVAENLFNEFYLNSIDVPEDLRFYIDYERFARDCKMNGDLYEFDFNGKTWTCTDPSQ